MLTFALETNIEEALGFLSFSGIIPWLIFILLITSFYYITKKNNGSGKLSKILLILSLIYPLTEYLFFNKYSIPRLYQLRKNPIELLSGAYKRFLLFKEPLNIFRYYNIKTYLKNALNKERTLPNGVTIQNNLKDDTHPKRIVFILGESDTKWHHGIYGYKHPTDPFMQEIIKDVKKSAVFNAIASASSTNLAVPRLMTFSTARDSEPGLENSNVIEMANMLDIPPIGYQNRMKRMMQEMLKFML